MTSKKSLSDVRPDVSHVRSNGRLDFTSLSGEERVVYLKWRRGAFVLYGVIALFLGGLILAGVHSADVSPELRAAPQVTLAKRGG